MDFTNDNSKGGDTLCFSSTNNLVYLLQGHPPIFEEPEATWSSTSLSFHPISFENPFEDPSMEPLPIRSTDHGTLKDLQVTDSTRFSKNYHNDKNDIPAPFMDDWDDRTVLCQDICNIILDPIVDIAGSKRGLDDIFTNQSSSKRRKISSVPTPEEMTVRFRPYQEKHWREQLRNLIEFKQKTGHCCVPHSYPEDPMLARWVKRQRYQYKKFKDGNPTSTMTHRRIEELETIGFVWHSHASAWFEKLNELKAFKKSKGHCNVPSHYPENVPLSTWVKCQRRQYKLYVSGESSSMTSERFQELKSMGFVFDGRRGQQGLDHLV